MNDRDQVYGAREWILFFATVEPQYAISSRKRPASKTLKFSPLPLRSYGSSKPWFDSRKSPSDRSHFFTLWMVVRLREVRLSIRIIKPQSQATISSATCNPILIIIEAEDLQRPVSVLPTSL